ncbi:MAG: hypothetical protein WCI55_03690 [Armatimonadota bacterium]
MVLGLLVFVVGCGGHGSGANSAQLAKYKALLNKAFAGKPAGHTRIPTDETKMLARRPIGRTPNGVGSVYFDDSNQVWVRVDAMVTETGEFGQIYIVQWDYALFQEQALIHSAGRDYHKEYIESGKNVVEVGSNYLFGSAIGNYFYAKSISDPVTLDTDVLWESKNPSTPMLFKSHTIWTEAVGLQTNASEQIYDNGYHVWTTGSWSTNGNIGYSYTDNSNYAISFNWVPDGSGGFTLAGPPTEPLLPATGSWASNGTGTVNFADGGSIPFTLGETGFNF